MWRICAFNLDTYIATSLIHYTISVFFLSRVRVCMHGWNVPMDKFFFSALTALSQVFCLLIVHLKSYIFSHFSLFHLGPFWNVTWTCYELNGMCVRFSSHMYSCVSPFLCGLTIEIDYATTHIQICSFLAINCYSVRCHFYRTYSLWLEIFFSTIEVSMITKLTLQVTLILFW